MTRRKQVNASQRQKQRKPSPAKPLSNNAALKDLLNWYAPQGGLFAKGEFHGNIKWIPEQLAVEALVWSWQEATNVTDAFDQTLEICGDLGLKDTAKTYTGFMNALESYHAATCTASAAPTSLRSCRTSPYPSATAATNRGPPLIAHTNDATIAFDSL